MQTLHNAPLAPYTSLKVGGSAKRLVICETYEEALSVIKESGEEPLTLLGFGSNSLISDRGLPGTTVLWRGGEIIHDDKQISADAGVWWDDVVKRAIAENLWGLELTSEIPSSVGGAVFGNIAAYGQQVSDTLAWVEVFDQNTHEIKRLSADDIQFAYRQSSLQSQPNLLILRVGFSLSPAQLHPLRYEAALVVARELGADTYSLNDLRRVIIETRRRAGSIYHPDDPQAQRTAGSFFKNPMVSYAQAVSLAAFDESGKTLERIQEQNKIHGGDALRASAAHVLLAAGFARGQQWGNVRLHPQHVLKVETLEGATAQEVYDVVNEIVSTVKTKLDITLVPEVRFLGDFT